MYAWVDSIISKQGGRKKVLQLITYEKPMHQCIDKMISVMRWGWWLPVMDFEATKATVYKVPDRMMAKVMENQK